MPRSSEAIRTSDEMKVPEPRILIFNEKWDNDERHQLTSRLIRPPRNSNP